MSYFCRITDCRAMLLGFAYWSFELDDGTYVAVCPRCAREINRLRKTP
jgi:hypothetical protein